MKNSQISDADDNNFINEQSLHKCDFHTPSSTTFRQDMKPPIAPVSNYKHQQQNAAKPIHISKETQTDEEIAHKRQLADLEEEV